MRGAPNSAQSFALSHRPGAELANELEHFAASRTSYTSVFQLPAWADVLYEENDCLFVTGRKNGTLNFFALVNRNGRKYFNIQFGPVCFDEAVWQDALAFMRRQFRYKAFCLSLQPDMNGLPAVYGAGHKGPGLYNWSTPVLDIGRAPEAIFRGFSENHRRAIKKAEKNGLAVAPVKNKAAAGTLAEIYLKMYAGRGLHADEAQVRRLWTGMQERFTAGKNEDGIIFSVQKEGRIIGGIVVTLCGGRAFYYMGCSDPDERKLPILHLAFWEAIKYCRDTGIHIFDFGGCNEYVNPGSQVYHINLFKKQFGPEIVRYPDRLYFSLIPSGTYLFHLMRKLRR